MNKIECLVSEQKMTIINNICSAENYTRAEFNRRAIDYYLEKPEFVKILQSSSKFELECPDCKAQLQFVQGDKPALKFVKHNI